MFTTRTLLSLSVVAVLMLEGCSSFPAKVSANGTDRRPAVPSERASNATPTPLRETGQPVLAGAGMLPQASTAEALYQSARAHQAKGRHDLAAEAYRDLIARYPMFVDAHNALGVSYAAQGRHGDAVLAFQSAIRVAPSRADLHNNLGYAQLLRNAEAEAIAAFREALRIDPAYSRAAHNLQLAQGRAKAIRSADTTGAAAKSVSASRPAEHVSTAPDAGLALVTVAPNIYELRVHAPVAAHRAEVTRQVIATQSIPVQVRNALLRVEVLNANGTRGMARRIAEGLTRRLNIVHAHLSDHPSKPATEVHYREGYASEAAAIAAMLPTSPVTFKNPHLQGGIQVRVVLGRDMGNTTALVDTHFKAAGTAPVGASEALVHTSAVWAGGPARSDASARAQ